jgi:ComF family protein
LISSADHPSKKGLLIICDLKASFTMPGILSAFTRDFVNLFFPPACPACNNILLTQESHICTGCLYNMPRTNFHLDPDNPMAQLFWGRVKVESAAAMYYFEKGSKCRKIFHPIKYRGQKELARYMGEIYAAELLRTDRFCDIDVILPVPLHPSKLKKRGFNQSEWFAKGLAQIMDKPVPVGVLQRILGAETQTGKSRLERWENVKDNFRLSHPEIVENKHALLVDDVVTTGATLEACAGVLLAHPGVRVSILTLAYA